MAQRAGSVGGNITLVVEMIAPAAGAMERVMTNTRTGVLSVCDTWSVQVQGGGAIWIRSGSMSCQNTGRLSRRHLTSSFAPVINRLPCRCPDEVMMKFHVLCHSFCRSFFKETQRYEFLKIRSTMSHFGSALLIAEKINATQMSENGR